MHKGYFAFVLHTDLAYVRQVSRRPRGEQMLHEAGGETRALLANALHGLKADECEPYLTIGFTPILLEQGP